GFTGNRCLETGDQLISLRFRRTSVEKKHLLASLLRQCPLQQVSHLHELGEDEAAIAFLAKLLHHIEQTLELIRPCQLLLTPGKRTFLRVKRRMVADLLQLGERGKD